MLEALHTHHPALSMPFRPLVPGQSPDQLGDWHDLAEDLIDYLDEQGFQGGIGIGHSLGGVATLQAACQRPDLFEGIILLDPVFLPRRIYVLMAMFPFSCREHLLPLARIARKRRDHWQDRQQAWDHLRRKGVFRRISDSVFQNMLEAMLVEEPDGSCRLAFSREWESRIYTTVSSPWKAIGAVKVPALILRGAVSDTISPDTWKRLQRLRPDQQFAEVANGGHLFPFEEPEQVASLIRHWAGLDQG